MVKSRAEIQKEYRQRLKEKDKEKYLEKERRRRMASYIPNKQLSRSERAKRNEQNRDYLRVYRARKRSLAQADVNDIQSENGNESNTSGYESSSSAQRPRLDGPRLLQVQMAFPARARGSRVRLRNALDEYKLEMKQWKKKYEILQRKYKTTQRSIQRSRQKEQVKQTPRSKTDRVIKNLRLNKVQASKVRKQLLFSNVLSEEISRARSKIRRNQRSLLHNLVGGQILKKYKCIQMASKATGLSRNKLGMIENKMVVKNKIKRLREVQKNRDNVISFMTRDDNSRMMPGKGDCRKDDTSKEKKQKRILTDYLGNLHYKFSSENPTVKLSLASFCRIRPKYILLASFISRSTCLCTKHQNMSLTLRAARKENVQISVNGDQMLETKEEFLHDLQDNLTSEDVVVSQWKRVPVEEKGKQKMVMKIVEQRMTKQAFIKHTETQVQEFAAHVMRVKTQYQEIRRLKENLPDHNVIVQMDFAENYSCKAMNEIQSAYWNQTSVTLHPFVVYFKSEDSSDLKHKSCVIISDELAHNSNTVLTFVDTILQEIRFVDLQVSTVHYWTDSPTSQYRNKFIFYEVANHEEIHGIKAKWNYFEAGHGKGPCDGLGGTTKRMADEAVNTGRAAIQSPADFFTWTQSTTCNLKNVKFIYVTKEECENKARLLAVRNPNPVYGTMKIHAVIGHGKSKVSVKETSCYCHICLSNTGTCEPWRKESVEKSRRDAEETIEVDTVGITTPKEAGVSVSQALKPNVNDYVAAMYSKKCFVGKVVDIDEEELEAEISFMETKKNLYQWPRHPDVIWVNFSDIIRKLKEPVPTGKSKRLFSIMREEREAIEHLSSV